MRLLARILIGVYRYALSPALHAMTPLFASGCRFTPSCSEYAGEAIGRYGIVRGGGLAARRLCRCHPWGGGGHDPVPVRRAAGHDDSADGSVSPMPRAS